MGRGGGDEATLAPARRGAGARAGRAQTPQQRFADFQREKLNIIYATDDKQLKEAMAYLRSLDPAFVGLDFETASKNGRWGSTNGTLRLIQIGLDEPERGISPTQILIDCHAVDPRPVVPLLRSKKIEKEIHYMDFENEWAMMHLGAQINNVYDTCLAWRVIQRKLREMDPREVEEILPGYERHKNNLSVLTRVYFGMEMPKDDQASDWGRPQLRAKQLIYAATDAAIMPQLTKLTKEVAAKIKVDKKIAGQTRWVQGKIEDRVRETQRRYEDDSVRLTRALKRCQSAADLERMWNLRRQMTIYPSSLSELEGTYQAQREKLAA